jgi:heparosan-N-sulfate-glucuronate 5-epimerase
VLSARSKSFTLPPGQQVAPGEVRGYYVDFTEKADAPTWPPAWFPWPGYHRFMAVAQWGLGCYERHLAGEGEQWLAATISAGRHLVDEQVEDGSLRGGWLEPFDYPHTFYVRGPWLSAMAQGQCASLLVRLAGATGDEEFAAAARAGLDPMRVPTTEGGVQAELDGSPFPEEYPTDPPAYVLNGAIFSIWGYYDVWQGLGDEGARAAFEDAVSALATSLHRWDTGYWSRYDLYPHPVLNVASRAYHSLHITQLRALHAMAPSDRIADAAARFERYERSRTCRARALGRKVFFRLIVPRNRLLAQRLPWIRDRRSGAKHTRAASDAHMNG